MMDALYVNFSINTIWDCLGDDNRLVSFCNSIPDTDFLLAYHPVYNITVLQWLLWYIGSGTRTFNTLKNNSKYSRKDWALHKLRLIFTNIGEELWRLLVHTPTGFSNRCTTIHFFARNSYKLNIDHLDEVNGMLDKVEGRFMYKNRKDEYGYTPGQYVLFHAERRERFKKKGKSIVDKIMVEYRQLEKKFSDQWLSTLEFLDTEKNYYFDWLKEVGMKKDVCINLPIEMRKLILKICKLRIDSHMIHDKIFQDKLSEVEKMEEKSNRNLTQNSNHLWIIKTYLSIISGTYEAKILENFIKIRRICLN